MEMFIPSLPFLLSVYVAPLLVIEYIANLLATGLVTIFDFWTKNVNKQF